MLSPRALLLAPTIHRVVCSSVVFKRLSFKKLHTNGTLRAMSEDTQLKETVPEDSKLDSEDGSTQILLTNNQILSRLRDHGIHIAKEDKIEPPDSQTSQARVSAGLRGENYDSTDQYTATKLSQIDVLIESSVEQGNAPLSRAHQIFKRLQKEKNYQFEKKVYDQFMFGYANVGNISMLEEFMRNLKTYHKPDILNYGPMLLAYSKITEGTKMTEIVKEARDNGIDLTTLLMRCRFQPEQQKRVIQHMQQVDPDFKAITNEDYISQMVEKHEMVEEENKAVIPQYEGVKVFSPNINSSKKKNDSKGALQIMYNLEVLHEVGLSPIEKQLKLEDRSHEIAIAQFKSWRNEITSLGRIHNIKPVKVFTLCWMEDLIKAIEQEQQKMNFKKADSNGIGCFINVLSAERLAHITINEAFSTIFRDTKGAAYGSFCMELGDKVFETYVMERTRQRANELKNPEVKKIWNASQKIYQQFMQDGKGSGRLRGFWKKMEETNPFVFQILEKADWPPIVQTKLGACLLHTLINTAMIDSLDPLRLITAEEKANLKDHPNIVPAFHHSYGFTSTRSIGFISPHSVVVDALSVQSRQMDNIAPNYLPMIAPPKPYTDFNRGGYYRSNRSIMRSQYHNSQARLLELRKEELGDVLDCLNVLSSVPWRINNPVLAVMTTIWNMGGDESLSLPSHHDVTSPIPPDDFDTNMAARMVHLKAHKATLKKNAELHSRRCDLHYRLLVAYNYRNIPFYMPHNLDFRGRCYPIPPHLNHIGSDTSRGLLLFDKAKPLGKHGVYWLKVQLANLYGNDKITLDARAQFIDDQWDDIVDSVKQPIEGRGWWRKADAPFQTLACCHELYNALQLDNPETFMSHLPVHQDGSCNGLQHYAALGGDILGAEEVNLMPSDSPRDVYEGVAKVVRVKLNRDAQDGHPMAELLKDKITRKVVKQTVMTSVYGVTFIGARDQIKSRLAENSNIPETDLYMASNYLAKTVLDSLQTLFTGAKEIQDWLAESAHRIALSGNPVHWITPLHLPVVQHYAKKTSTNVATSRQSIEVVDEGTEPAVAKQRSAFPPNFIHSLDSTHMLMTAKACGDKGITFAAVHDSYWTHAADVVTLNETLRNEFIHMHSQPILENLVTHWRQFYHGVTIRKRQMEQALDFDDVPKRGLINLEEIRNSKYFFD